MGLLQKYFRTEAIFEKASKEYTVKDYDDTFAIPRVTLRLGGMRLTRNDIPFVRFLWNAFYWFSFCNLLMAACLELTLMVQTAQGGSLQEAADIFRMMPCVGVVLLSMAKSSMIVCYRPMYENLISELREIFPRGTLSDEEHRVLQIAGRQRNFLTKGMITNCYTVSADLLFFIFVSHISTQFDLLSVRIKRLIHVPIDKQLVEGYPLASYNKKYGQYAIRKELYSDKYWEEKHEKDLAEIILRHRTLIRLSGDIEKLFSFSLLLHFCNSSVIICFCGFLCVMVEKWNEFVYKSFLIAALVQAWLMCWYGQRLLDSSSGVSDALYNSGWYKASIKIRRSILIMLHRSQKEIHVTTYGFTVVSLASFTTIMKTAWSYFTLMQNIYTRKQL